MGTMRIRRGAGSSRLRRIELRVLAITAALAIAASTIVGTQAARADDYPTWDDVAAARNDQARTEAAVAQIRSLLAALEAEAARAQADAEAKGNVYQEADTKYQAAASRAQTLQEQADAAQVQAESSVQRAGLMVAQLVRGGGEDPTANLLMNAAGADDLLNSLGMSRKVSEQAYAIYERALLDKNTAQALTDQADVAKRELETLKIAAEKAFAEAQAAAVAAAQAVEAQRAHKAQLEAQLVVLTERRAATEADYIAGVQARIAADVSADYDGYVSDSGWVRPSGGYITSVYGWSAQYGSSFHKGTDLGAGCGANIYAASGGTISYAAEGWNGGYGNYIIIDHGDGVQTAYGHIRPGGILVSAGQSVGVGTNIAKVGTTGNSTGCHLPFEVRINGNTTNPVSYMAGQGITLG
jgi:murein DD-endopeptidase MepM/ murein hydrolase activator NlpD